MRIALWFVSLWSIAIAIGVVMGVYGPRVLDWIAGRMFGRP